MLVFTTGLVLVSGVVLEIVCASVSCVSNVCFDIALLL